MKNLLTLFAMVISCAALAQDKPFKQLRFDEDYRYLKKDSTQNWYNQFKFTPLNKSGNTYISYGGEVRYQYFYFKNEGWGSAPEDRDGYILSRFLLHADLHEGKNFRTFIQLQSSLADGQVNEPSPVDRNPLEIHQLFQDIGLTHAKSSSINLRLGRQELSYGSQRLVAVREAPNNRQSFDAARLMYHSGAITLDGFYGHYVQAKSGIFDDSFNKNTRLWGAYAVLNKVPVIQNIDLYYIGLLKNTAVFNAGTGREVRHSIGSRVWKAASDWQYDLEALYQFGKFGTGNISAWTVSSNVSYKLSNSGVEPQIGLKAEVISGDKDRQDNRLNTFNPLFPKGAYFGQAALIGPSNLFDMHPYAEISLTKHLKLLESYDMFWRLNEHDGLYAVSGKLIYPDKNIASKDIGRQLETELEYAPNKYLFFRGEFTWFQAGDFLKAAGPGKDILMAGTTVTLKF